MKTLWIVPIEPIDQRYTKQWYENIPKILGKRIKEHPRAETWEVRTIDGLQPGKGTTKGAFLDFATTNIYKATQVQEISTLFLHNKIKPGDKFLVTDAWNFSMTAIRYMSDLLDIPVEIHGIWHAGAYDPTDILGMKMSKPWPQHQERAWYYACDYNYYATNFHKNMFLKNLDITDQSKAIRSGQPHTPIIDQLTPYFGAERDGSIMWPHRYNADKQPEIAESLAKDLDIKITQKLNLSKDKYYKAMGSASAIFSCALHENLGISVMEGVLAGAMPIVPDRASYAEMYSDEFKYPSIWTANAENFAAYRGKLINFILERVQNRDKYLSALTAQRQHLIDAYLQPTVMIDKILDLE
jgi:hypothetical protein